MTSRIYFSTWFRSAIGRISLGGDIQAPFRLHHSVNKVHADRGPPNDWLTQESFKKHISIRMNQKNSIELNYPASGLEWWS